jgi:hypothetical protein
MSDLNSSVRDEQIGDPNEFADNTEPVNPVNHETPGPETADNVPVADPVADPDQNPPVMIEIHEELEVIQPVVIPGLSEHETEDFQEFFKELDDKHEIPVKPVLVDSADDPNVIVGEMLNYGTLSKDTRQR